MCNFESFFLSPTKMQPIQQVFTSTPKHSSVAVLEPSDVVLEVADCDTPGQTASHALTRQGSDCTSSACVDVSWIKLREQRWFCGWNWTVESLSSQSSSTKNVVTGTANKPVSVNDLAGNFTQNYIYSSRPTHDAAAYAGSASSLQAKVAQSQADIKKLLASLQVCPKPFMLHTHCLMHWQNFSNRMEKQASISNAVAPADVSSSGYCKVSAHLPAVAKRIAFLTDLPDDVLFKCATRLHQFSSPAHSTFICILPDTLCTGLSLLSPSCLGAVAQTCSRLRSAASADSLWQPLSIQMWSRLQPQPPQSFKQVIFYKYQPHQASFSFISSVVPHHLGQMESCFGLVALGAFDGSSIVFEWKSAQRGSNYGYVHSRSSL